MRFAKLRRPWLVSLLAWLMAPEGRTVWTTAAGVRVPVSEMNNEHLLNACRLVEEKLVAWAALRQEIVIRGLTPKEPRPPETLL